MKRILLFAFLFIVSAALHAQHELRGKVRNEQGEALPDAFVRLGEKHAVTKADGTFAIGGLSSGTFQLAVSFLGYETWKGEVELRGDKELDIVMKESSFMAGEVVISGIRARKDDPVAFTELTAEELEKSNFGRDLPYLISMTPGLVVSSDAGSGVGYTSMRLRGSDITRINVTVNGIPLNDAESQGVFWVNMPDFASSVSHIQVQRGVGTSTNGAASFGGSINISTIDGPSEARVVIDNSYGSFNTLKNSVQLSTRIPGSGFAFDARLSNITSDGFVDRGSSELKSYYLSGAWYGNATSVRLVTFSGKEKTYQAWNGVPLVKLKNDSEGIEKLIMLDGWSDEEADNLRGSDSRTFNRYLYSNQTDNYQQDHYQLHFTHAPSALLSLNVSLHYTRGKGYYESYKYNERFSKYNLPLPSELVIDGVSYSRTDLINQKWLDNHFYGATFSGAYEYGKLHLVAGGAINRYDGKHYGEVIWTKINAGVPDNYRWYENDGVKDDLNYYTKVTYTLFGSLGIYTDLQGRHVSYDIEGVHDDMRDLTRTAHYDFFNPKFGINWKIDEDKRIFASVAVSNKEPSRSDFRDADDELVPQPEKLIDYELGFDWMGEMLGFQANGFYMDYKDQLVLTGKINNVGAYIMNNVPESYRTGIELAGFARVAPWLTASANAVFSANKIKDFTEYVDDWDNGGQLANYLGNTNIAFSPSSTIAARLEAQPLKGLSAILDTRYVGEQYIDNSSSRDRMLDSYMISDLVLRYKVPTKSGKNTRVELGFQVGNLFDKSYISNAWVYSFVLDGKREVLDGYFPQAGRNFTGQVVLRF
ncbi:MAG: TonB-dependent receptor [Bacteroidota bacterium]|jgi:iron complex outermembrane receptor protein|nr:TonB-dependent receptor [Bacteroidota bacterium]